MTTTTLSAPSTPSSATARYGRYAKPYVAKLQELLAIDRVFVAAQGDELVDADGRTVLDFLGGYGSTMLGHNHPRLVSVLCNAYRANVPTHVQASVREPAARLAARLDARLRESLPGSPAFVVHFANTGTEAVEAAIKHATLEFVARRRNWSMAVEKMLVERREHRADDGLLDALTSWKAAVQSTPPTLLAVKGSYHGKTAGSVAATSNPAYRQMFDQAPIRTAFLDPHDLVQCDKAVRALIIESPLQGIPALPPLLGVLFEPLQCEGGMRSLPDDFIVWLQNLRQQLDVPLIADEIQSGFYRTGRFLCCEHAPLVPDYVLLGKSLGGGLSKISAACIVSTRYQDEFGWLHSSTFAEDEPSCLVALAAIDEIESAVPSVAERARCFEQRLRAGVAHIQETVGHFISEVRGTGLLIGLQFDLSGASEEIPLFLKTATDAGLGSYLFMSHLLAQHNIRVGVTLSDATVLRIEPSLFISAEHVDRLLVALRSMCELIRDRRVLELTKHLWRDQLDPGVLATQSRALPRGRTLVRDSIPRVSFITHVIDLANVGNMDASLALLSEQERRRFMGVFGDVADPVVYHEQEIESNTGERILLEVYGIMRTTDFFENSLRQRNFAALHEVRDAVALAGRRGSTLAGLGQYTSIVSSNGQLVRALGPAITTGNSLTAGFAFETLRKALRDRGRELSECRIGVVGAAGNICNVLAQLIADHAAGLTLIHRGGTEAESRMEIAAARVCDNSTMSPTRVRVSGDRSELALCDAIVLGTSTSEALITPEMLQPNAVIIDISVPSNVSASVFEERSDVAAYHGALARLPHDQVLSTDWMPLPSGQIYACLAETIVLGLSGRRTDFSVGALRKTQVLEALQRASEVGVQMGRPVRLRTR